MPHAAQSAIASAPAFDSVPYRIDHSSSRVLAVVLLAILVAMACIVIVPVALILIYAAHDLWTAIARKPLATVVLASGLTAWTALLALAAARVVQRSWRRRSVCVTLERVVVCDSGLFGSALWTRPLAEFRGIAHHVRATLTGVRHELILVHPVRGLSVVLHTAERISQPAIDRAAALLHLPQIPARELYRLSSSGLAEVTEAAHAPVAPLAQAPHAA